MSGSRASSFGRFGRSDWSSKLIRGLRSKTAAGFRSRRGRCHEPTPVTLTMLLLRHTRRREFIAGLGGAAAAWPRGRSRTRACGVSASSRKANPGKASQGTPGAGSPAELSIRALSRGSSRYARPCCRANRADDRPSLQCASAGARWKDQGIRCYSPDPLAGRG